MSAVFACVVARDADGDWSATEVDVADCESVQDLADTAADVPGDVRLLLLEQDDEYAAIVRVDDVHDDPRAFLSDGHAADFYPVAAYVAEPPIGARPAIDATLTTAPRPRATMPGRRRPVSATSAVTFRWISSSSRAPRRL